MLKMIVAMDRNRLIGKDGALPWHLPNDLSYFKKMTLQQIVVMGRMTFESLSEPLPERRNIVLTSDLQFQADGVEVMRNTEDILDLAKNETVFIIGGAMVCKQFLPYTEKLYITSIDESFEGDVYFPPIQLSEWELDSEINGKTDEKNIYPHKFLTYIRKSKTRA